MDISVIGTGYVGLVTGALLADRGNKVTCVDINPEIVASLNSGRVHIFEPGLENVVARNVERGNLTFTGDINEAVEKSRVHFLAVGTPSDTNGAFNLRYVLQAAEDVGRALHEAEGFNVVVGKSTVPQGTYRQVEEILSSQIGENRDWAYVSNPEFLAEGSAVRDFERPSRIVVGTRDERAHRVMRELYHPFNIQRDKIIECRAGEAEVIKLGSNTMLALRIAGVNEVARMCDSLGDVDMDIVRLGMCEDPRIGHKFMYPGPGYGGSCFPKDVQGLVAKSGELGYSPLLLSRIHESNEEHKNYLGERIVEILAMGNPNVGIWGLTFKPNTDDMREAASIPIIETLLESGAKVVAYDPQPEKAKEIFGEKIGFVNSKYEVATGADALVLLTEWREFDAPNYEKLTGLMKGRKLFDLRNRWLPEAANNAGFSYFGVGRNYPLR